jgi:protein-tyrosine phosphatase
MTIYYSAHARYSALPPEPAGFRILHVCVANQCRSPMAERITRHELAHWLGDSPATWSVTSAGTQASDGQPMHRHSARALAALGIDVEDFHSRRLTEQISLEADLILAATACERDLVISRVPATLPTAFTLREFARLVGALPDGLPRAGSAPHQNPWQAEPSTVTALDETARAIVAAARKLRGRVPYVEPVADDLVDPPRTASAFEHCAAEISAAVDTILSRLVAVAGPTGAEVGAGTR